jgi:hypothetical protein
MKYYLESRRREMSYYSKIEGEIEVAGGQGRRSKQLLDDLKETSEYWTLKEEALDSTLWRTRFGRGCGLS